MRRLKPEDEDEEQEHERKLRLDRLYSLAARLEGHKQTRSMCRSKDDELKNDRRLPGIQAA